LNSDIALHPPKTPTNLNESIVVTDGHTLNPGDLSWKSFDPLGTVQVYDHTPAELILQRCKSASVILTNKTPVSKAVIDAAEKLKVIAVTATGYNIVDTNAARGRGVVVCNVPGYGTDSVAQHTFALILELTNHVGLNTRSVASGDWSRIPHFCYSVKPVIELSGKTIGIVGYGKIGQKVGQIARAFGMEVLYNSPSLERRGGGVSMERLFSESDFVSLHCPLTAYNDGFVNKRLLSLMKRGSFLINTARGQLVNEPDLANALNEGMIGGAALDVLSVEPPREDHPLIGLPNCIITPHNAWYSFEARRRIMETTYRNVEAALAGLPINQVP
jgi:glycerate dehydrogenase